MDPEKCKILLEVLDSRTIGKGLMGLLITSWTIKKMYTKIKIRRNIKIIEIKRKEIAKRKKSLEERYNPSILLDTRTSGAAGALSLVPRYAW